MGSVRTTSLRIMVSRRIVTAPVIGLLFGEPGIGLMIGMAFGVERTLGGFTRELITLILIFLGTLGVSYFIQAAWGFTRMQNLGFASSEEVKAGRRDIASLSSFKRGVMGSYGSLWMRFYGLLAGYRLGED